MEKSQSQSMENTLGVEKSKLVPAINTPVSNNEEKTITIKSTKQMSDSASISFEKSLDNLLDKCSEKSVDLNLSLEFRDGGHSDVSKSCDNSPIISSKKSDKKKVSSPWYTVSLFISLSKYIIFVRGFPPWLMSCSQTHRIFIWTSLTGCRVTFSY